MNFVTVVLLIAIATTCSAYLCSLHFCLHNHHCCSFNCTVRGCMCLPNGKECKVNSACCSKICYRTDVKNKLGMCQESEGTPKSTTIAAEASTASGTPSTSPATTATEAASTVAPTTTTAASPSKSPSTSTTLPSTTTPALVTTTRASSTPTSNPIAPAARLLPIE